jgi:hypothetical protein
MNFEDKRKETLESIESSLGSITLDDIKSEGVTVRFGNKIVKMSVVGEYDESNIENEIREELKKKLQKRLLEVSSVVNKKLNDMSEYFFTLKSELEIKNKELERKMESKNLMPDITLGHLYGGLSLAKGEDGSLFWVFQSVYWPKYIDNDYVIEPSYSKRLMNHILIVIETRKNKVLNVKLRTPIGFHEFEHYHTNCWGNWKFKNEWETPDDIIAIAKEAEVVLETINTGSLASRSPNGLMRIETLRKHSFLRSKENTEEYKATKKMENIGVTDNFARDGLWTV